MQPRRVKRFSSRSRTGRLTCRSRHVNCGEEKPRCKRCIATMLDCRYLGVPSLQAADYPPGTQATWRQRSLFDYFRAAVIHRASDPLNAPLFSHHLLQGAQAHPAIWHACLAQSATCRWLELTKKRESDASLYALAVEEHARALCHIIKVTAGELSLADKIVILSANVLLVWHATLTGRVAESVSHVTHGIALISHWRMWEHHCTPLLLFHASVDGLSQDVWPYRGWLWRELLHYLHAKGIQSPGQACLELECIWIGVRSRLLSRLACQDFRPFLDKLAAKIEAFVPAAQDAWLMDILSMRMVLLRAMLRVDVHSLETSWDARYGDFEAAVAIMERLLPSDRPIRTSALIVTKSMEFVAWNCRHSALRRRAVDVLKWQHDREYDHGVDFPIYVWGAQAVIAVEESHIGQACGCLPTFICKPHRIANTRLFLDSGRTFYRLVGGTEWYSLYSFPSTPAEGKTQLTR